MTDLVDYLRDKLEQADKPGPPFGVRPGEIAYGDLRALLWPDHWHCCVCAEVGPYVDDSLANAWDHLDTHRPPVRRWWRG